MVVLFYVCEGQDCFVVAKVLRYKGFLITRRTHLLPS